MSNKNTTNKAKLFYVAKYLEEDAHSRNYGKEMFCFCTSEGWSRRGLRLDEWYEVVADNGAQAKRVVEMGGGDRRS